MKTAGIIGGLGPETTSEFYLELVFGCQKVEKNSRPPILIKSVPLPYQIEKEAITEGVGEERCVPFLLEAAQNLEKASADFLVMPCNSLHEFIDEIRNSVKIPVLSILEETATFLKNQGIKKVGVISTSITAEKKLYEDQLAMNGIDQVAPNEYQQAKIGKIIYNLVSNRHSNSDRQELIEIINDLERKNLKHVILACTDLQILIPSHATLQIYDTMKIFADAVVTYMLQE